MTDEPMGRLLKVNVSKDQKGRTTAKPQLANVILHLVGRLVIPIFRAPFLINCGRPDVSSVFP